jgi:hypothetical protein
MQFRKSTASILVSIGAAIATIAAVATQSLAMPQDPEPCDQEVCNLDTNSCERVSGVKYNCSPQHGGAGDPWCRSEECKET